MNCCLVAQVNCTSTDIIYWISYIGWLYTPNFPSNILVSWLVCQLTSLRLDELVCRQIVWLVVTIDCRSRVRGSVNLIVRYSDSNCHVVGVLHINASNCIWWTGSNAVSADRRWDLILRFAGWRSSTARYVGAMPWIHLRGYQFSAISGNLEMSRKSQWKGPKSGHGQGICVDREFDCGSCIACNFAWVSPGFFFCHESGNWLAAWLSG